MNSEDNEETTLLDALTVTTYTAQDVALQRDHAVAVWANPSFLALPDVPCLTGKLAVN